MEGFIELLEEDGSWNLKVPTEWKRQSPLMEHYQWELSADSYLAERHQAPRMTPGYLL